MLQAVIMSLNFTTRTIYVSSYIEVQGLISAWCCTKLKLIMFNFIIPSNSLFVMKLFHCKWALIICRDYIMRKDDYILSL